VCIQSTSFPWNIFLHKLVARVHGMLLNIYLTSRSCTLVKFSLASVQANKFPLFVHAKADMTSFITKLLGKKNCQFFSVHKSRLHVALYTIEYHCCHSNVFLRLVYLIHVTDFKHFHPTKNVIVVQIIDFPISS
jgi:hypothetical protein